MKRYLKNGLKEIEEVYYYFNVDSVKYRTNISKVVTQSEKIIKHIILRDKEVNEFIDIDFGYIGDSFLSDKIILRLTFN
jgi:hypothetical protein